MILYGRRSGARFTHRSLHVSRRRGTPTASTEATRPTGVELHEPGHRLRRGLLERRAAGLRQVDGMPREPACGLAEQSRSEPLASHRHALRRTSRYAQVNRHAKALGVSRRDPSSAFGTKRSPSPGGHCLRDGATATRVGGRGTATGTRLHRTWRRGSACRAPWTLTLDQLLRAAHGLCWVGCDSALNARQVVEDRGGVAQVRQ